MTSAVPSAWPAVAVAVPAVATVAAIAARRLSERARRTTLLALAVATAAITLGFVPGVLAGSTFETFVLRLTPQTWLMLRVDAAGALYAATVATLWVLAVPYSFGYLAGDAHLARYFAFLMGCLACLIGVAYSGTLLTLLIFYELFSVLTYALVVHEETPAALAAGTKYIVYILVGGSLILAGVLLTFFLAGGVAFAPGGLLDAGMPRVLLLVTFACFVVGFGVKAALIPLHGWVPDAHPAAPAPVSALLSGVMVAAGGFGLVRVLFEVFGTELLAALGALPWLAGVAAATVLLGALLALGEDDLKRRLAYSTISQMGYLTLALALAAPGTLAAGLVHLAHHAFMKATLFLCAGVWLHRAGLRRIRDLRGMAARTPWTAAAFTVAALAMMGTPPLSGFVSKWWLGVGMLDAGAGWALAVLLAGALLAAGYLLPVVFTLYLAPKGAERAERSDDLAGPVAAKPPTPPEPPVSGPEAPASMLVPTLAAAGLTVLLGLASSLDGLPLSLARRAADTLLGGG